MPVWCAPVLAIIPKILFMPVGEVLSLFILSAADDKRFLTLCANIHRHQHHQHHEMHLHFVFVDEGFVNHDNHQQSTGRKGIPVCGVGFVVCNHAHHDHARHDEQEGRAPPLCGCWATFDS